MPGVQLTRERETASYDCDRRIVGGDQKQTSLRSIERSAVLQAIKRRSSVQEERRVTQATKASREAPAAHSWAMSRNVVEAVDADWSTSDQERRVGLNARPEAVSSMAKMANEWVER